MNVRQITAGRLTGDEVAQVLTRSLDSTFTRGEDLYETFRISLAGAQEKTALLFRGGAWQRPTHATPTTHSLKLPLGANPQGIDRSTPVENQWLCLEVVRA